ncbi:MAG: 1-phosphofructokinase [Clostridia bacterium]|nr:1-phosphofructokinase [Clostridia bacterium]
MIYTVTFSPAIDYVVLMDELKIGVTNRTKAEYYNFGGKGINVSRVLTELGVDNTALGFVSGFTGEALEKGLKEKGIRTDFVKLDNGITRINVKIKGNQETEINAQGPSISQDHIEELMKKLDRMGKGDCLIISGNVPNTLPDDMYEIILKRLSGRGIGFVIDATGELLVNVLKYKPFLIKPNKKELEDITGLPIITGEDLRSSAEYLQRKGARNVLVSLGADGAYLLSESGKEYKEDAIHLEVRNTVGSGDSMVAGFLAGYAKDQNPEYALKLGIAAGSATAASSGTADRDKINEFLQLMRGQKNENQ